MIRVEWAMERDNGWLVWDVAKFRTAARAQAFIDTVKRECPRVRRIRVKS